MARKKNQREIKILLHRIGCDNNSNNENNKTEHYDDGNGEVVDHE